VILSIGQSALHPGALAFIFGCAEIGLSRGKRAGMAGERHHAAFVVNAVFVVFEQRMEFWMEFSAERALKIGETDDGDFVFCTEGGDGFGQGRDDGIASPDKGKRDNESGADERCDIFFARRDQRIERGRRDGSGFGRSAELVFAIEPDEGDGSESGGDGCRIDGDAPFTESANGELLNEKQGDGAGGADGSEESEDTE